MKFTKDKAIEILERTPHVLNHLLGGLSEEWTHQNEGDNTWNAFDVVGHLIHGEKTDWIPRAQLILSDSPNKTFKPFDRFAQYEISKGKTLTDLLKEFEELRVKNITVFKTMTINEETLSHEGIHPNFGTVTLRHHLSTWVTHDLNHIAQISRVMAKCYLGEVGPWTKFIKILRD